MLASRPVPYYRLASAVIALQLLGLPFIAQTGAPSSQAAQQPATTGQIAVNYGRIPLSFEANRGQIDPSVQFLSHGRGFTLFLRQGEAILALRGPKLAGTSGSSAAGLRKLKTAPAREIETVLVRMRLVGGNLLAAVGEEDKQITTTNYFIGSDPAKWRTDIPNYGRVHYGDIYPGIDLVYYGNQRQLEHDFIVAPGADPTRIRLALNGAKQMRTDPVTGDLVLGTAVGELRLLRPVVYQESRGRRTSISSGYKILDQNHIAFSLGHYNPAQPLVIDPVLVYSTYLGGTGNSTNDGGDKGNGIAVDSNGDAYIVGTSYSGNFPTTTGVFQTQNGSAPARAGTVFVSELSSTGTALVFSTYLGGSGGDFGYGIALDSLNNAYVTGATYSTDFPVTCGAFQTTNPTTTTGASTGFVARLNSTGNGLAYSTYLGGDGNMASPPHGDVAQAITVDESGNAYVTGYTRSRNFPTTKGAFETGFAGSATASNAFVTELNPGGTELVYSTFLGGSGSGGAGDAGNAIAIDVNGDAFVAGSASSSNFPVTDGVFQSASHGSQTGFVTEFNPSGANEVFSTFLGGSGGDSAQAIAVDGDGFVYVAGNTSSSDFPLTSGTLENVDSGVGTYVSQYGPFGFVAKLNQGASALEYSTYVEGHSTSVTGLAVDSNGDAYLTGTSATTAAGLFGGFQSTPDALMIPGSTSNSAFLVELDPTAALLSYATLLGGSEKDGSMALALDTSEDVYLTGYANSSDFPTTTGAYQIENNAAAAGASNAFVGKFALAEEANQTAYPSIPSNLATSMSVLSQQGGWDCPNGGSIYIDVTISLNTGLAGPPPTGTIDYTGPWFQSLTYPVSGLWGGSTVLTLSGASESSTSGSWSATYSGDSVFQGSTISGNVDLGTNPCNSGQSRGPINGHRPRIHLRVQTVPPLGEAIAAANPAPATSGPAGLKFVPLSLQSAGRLQQASHSVQGMASAACVTPIPTLYVTVLPSTAHRFYGAANPTFTYSVTGLLNGDSVTVTTPESAAVATSPVGAYPVTVTVGGTALANYRLVIENATLTVFPAVLNATVAPSTASRLYGAANPNFTVSAITGLLNGDTVTATPQPPPLTAPVGSYAVPAVLSGPAAKNYIVVAGSATLTITQAPLTVTVLPFSRPYGAPNPMGPSVDFADEFTASMLFLNGSSEIVSNSLLLTNDGYYEAASAYFKTPVLVTAFGTTFNFQITGGGVLANGMTFVLQSQGTRALGSTGDGLGYGADTFSPGSPVISPSAAVKFDLYNSSGQGSDSTGFYTDGAEPTVPSVDMSNSGVNLQSGHVFQAQLSYDGQNLLETITDTVTQSSFSYTYTGINLPQILGASTAYVGFTAGTGSDSEVTKILSWSYSTASTVSPQPTLYTVAGLVNGDSVVVTLQTTATQTSTVGTYPLTAVVSGLAAPNYAITVNNSTLTVTAEPLILSAPSYNSTYGQTPPPPTYLLTGFVNGDTAAKIVSGAPVTSIAGTLSPTTPPGNYPVQIAVGTLKSDSLNYTITTAGSTPGYLIVNKAPLLVASRDAYQLVGATPGGFTYAFNGFVNHQTASVISGEPTLKTKATASSLAGVYPINISVGTMTAANYDFVFEPGFLNIFQPVDLGLVAVGKTVSQQLTFGNGPANSVGTATALTDGVVEQIFNGASISESGSSYTANVNFTPNAPGLWNGALQILDSSTPAQPLISIPIYGEGLGPQLVFDPGTISEIQPAGSLQLSGPQAVAVDENGSLYIADEGNDRILKVEGKTISVVALTGINLKSPCAVAIDGSGNLDIADSGNNRIVQLTAEGMAQVLALDKVKLSGPRGLVVDAGGDLLIADTEHNRIVKLSAAGISSIVSLGTITLSGPIGLTEDTMGDLFIADTGDSRIVEVAPSGTASVVATGTPSLESPAGIAVDPAGTLYISEAQTDKLVEVSSAGTQTEVAASSLSSPHGIALDHNGALYVADTGNNLLLEVKRGLSPTLKFDSTNEGKTSADSPKTATARNIGNTAVTISGVAYPADFPEAASGKSKDCKPGKILAQAGSCTLTIDFRPDTPVSTGSSTQLKESVKLTNNSLNRSGAVQSVTVVGTEIK